MTIRKQIQPDIPVFLSLDKSRPRRYHRRSKEREGETKGARLGGGYLYPFGWAAGVLFSAACRQGHSAKPAAAEEYRRVELNQGHFRPVQYKPLRRTAYDCHSGCRALYCLRHVRLYCPGGFPHSWKRLCRSCSAKEPKQPAPGRRQRLSGKRHRCPALNRRLLAGEKGVLPRYVGAGLKTGFQAKDNAGCEVGNVAAYWVSPQRKRRKRFFTNCAGCIRCGVP